MLQFLYSLVSRERRKTIPSKQLTKMPHDLTFLHTLPAMAGMVPEA